MLIETLETLVPLFPMDGFRFEGVLPYIPEEKMTLASMKKQKPTPDLSPFLSEEKAPSLSLGWNEGGLCVYLETEHPLTKVEYPHFSDGDALELFIDTRDLKESRFFHPFCHRFLFLPKEVRGVIAQETSVFRKEEARPLADPSDLSVQVKSEKMSYAMFIKIGSSALYGFDPNGFTRIGISCRLHRSGARPWQFASLPEHFSLEQQPRFWASFLLTHPTNKRFS